MKAAVLALVVVACASSPRGTPGSADKDAQKSATKRGRELVQEVYTSLRRGDVDGLVSIVSPSLLAIGPRGDQVFRDRGDLLIALGGAFPPGKKHKVTSRDLVVVSSPGGKAAWATDRVDIDGAKYRMSAILAEVDDIWVVTAVQVTRSEEPAKGDLPPLAGGVDPGAADAATLFKAAVAQPRKAAEQLSERKEAVVFGLGIKPTRGAKAIQKSWKKLWKKADPAERRLKGSPLGQATSDGTLAFVCGNVDATRTCMTYEYAGSWRLVAVNEGAE